METQDTLENDEEESENSEERDSLIVRSILTIIMTAPEKRNAKQREIATLLNESEEPNAQTSEIIKQTILLL